jgi:diguanylate cyclase
MMVPLAAASLPVLAVLVWLLAGHPGDPRVAFAAGPVACAAAVVACGLIKARPVRAFWRLIAGSAACVGAGAAVEIALLDRPSLFPYVVSPILVGVLLFLLALVLLPRERDEAGSRAPVLLDSAVAAVGGGMIFYYVLAELASPDADPPVQRGAALLGVVCLFALVVIGRIALSPATPVDPTALRLLALAPLTAVTAATLLITLHTEGRLWLSVLAVPLIATAVCSAAYRQHLIVNHPRPAPKAVASCSLHQVLPQVAVFATACLVLLLSAAGTAGTARVALVGTGAIAVLVMARHLVGLRAGDRLVADLRRRQALAFQDPLTGLPNRAGFVRLLTERPGAIMVIDIDDFTLINESMGYAAGDRLLQSVAERLAGLFPHAARLGGDEFAVLVDDPGDETAAATLAALSAAYPTRDEQRLVRVSIGVAPAGPGDTAEELLRNADIAVHAVKESGKAGWRRYEPGMRQRVVDHVRLAAELHDGIHRGQLYLLYQPVVDLATGCDAGAEALVRWHHPERGMVSPVEFIPVAERSGLIVPLGSWVLRTACEQLAGWLARYGTASLQSVNVNVAARQLREPGFVDEVAAVLSETGLLPGNLVVEVTESSVIEGPAVRESLQALHDMGVRLALDDFGTGQSSLSVLRAFPVDVLKLDKSFVDGIHENADKGVLAVAAAVAELAEHLDLYTVAEGIESPDQAARLREMGYDRGQGYLWAKPLPPAEMEERMSATINA